MVHPDDAEAFDWNYGNVEELARHSITPFEVEEVFANERSWMPNKRSGVGNWMMIGRTDGGRLITVVILFTEDNRTIRPITGWDSDTGERTEFVKRRYHERATD